MEREIWNLGRGALEARENRVLGSMGNWAEKLWGRPHLIPASNSRAEDQACL